MTPAAKNATLWTVGLVAAVTLLFSTAWLTQWLWDNWRPGAYAVFGSFCIVLAGTFWYMVYRSTP